MLLETGATLIGGTGGIVSADYGDGRNVHGAKNLLGRIRVDKRQRRSVTNRVLQPGEPGLLVGRRACGGLESFGAHARLPGEMEFNSGASAS